MLQNLFVVAASYVFYGWWDWRFLFLIFLTTASCFLSGLLIDKASTKSHKKIICGINIVLNISILCYYKYFNFFSENLKLLFEQFGYQLDWFTLDILLPVGISFYTFQAISYPIDVYRGNIYATRNFIAFMAFISFFPQLVAGPIERSTQLLPQFLHKRDFDYHEAIDGMRQALWGFFKKIVIADNCAMIANNIFGCYSDCNAATLWVGGILFAFQIYGDFSGYSDIAIGTSRLFGINLSRNFHYPYFSRDISEFWRRWHISLNTWFKDYVYIPLGGNRCSKAKMIRNTLIVFLLSGLWHGANWTFVVWGGWNALLIIPVRVLKLNGHNQDVIAFDRSIPFFKDVIKVIVTFICVVIGWIIFRSESIADATKYLKLAFTIVDSKLSTITAIGCANSLLLSTSLMVILLIVIEWYGRRLPYGLQVMQGKNIIIRWGMYLLIMFFILIFAGQQEQFIYFQF